MVSSSLRLLLLVRHQGLAPRQWWAAAEEEEEGEEERGSERLGAPERAGLARHKSDHSFKAHQYRIVAHNALLLISPY